MDTQPPDDDVKATADGEPQQEPRTPGRARRLAVRAGAVLLALLVALLVTVLTIDLGPTLRARAEREGTNYLQRPLHIGRLSARLIPGVFVFENLMIEGLSPSDRPFLTAKKITVQLPWW
jgi:hypothetical protein